MIYTIWSFQLLYTLLYPAKEDTRYKVYVCSIWYTLYSPKKMCRLTYVVIFLKLIERRYFPHVSSSSCFRSCLQYFSHIVLYIIQQRNIVCQVCARVGNIKFCTTWMRDLLLYCLLYYTLVYISNCYLINRSCHDT